MYWLKPSSIQPYQVSLLLTVIGHHWCPVSWSAAPWFELIDHRVFHSRAGAVLQRELRELVRGPELRVELERVARDRAGVGVERWRAPARTPCDRHRPLARDRRARRLPDVLLRRRPGEVVDRVGHEVPDEAIAGPRSPGPGPDFVRRPTMVDHGVGLQDVRDPFARLGGQDLLRVLEHAGAAHDPAGRDVDPHVEPAEVVVELRRPEVELVSQPRRSSYIATRGYHCVGWNSVSSKRCVMRWPRPSGPPGSFVCHAISSDASDFGGIGAGQADAAERLIEIRCREPARCAGAASPATAAACGGGAFEIHHLAIDLQAS